jgi:hypothetical protein
MIKETSCELSRRIKPRVVVECDISSSLITEIETGRRVAIASAILRHASGKRLVYRPLTGTTEVMSGGIARATKGDVTRAGEKLCEILRKTSDDRLWQNQSQPGLFEHKDCSLRSRLEKGVGHCTDISVFKIVSGKRLVFRPIADSRELITVGIARATNGDVTSAGEKFCEILRKISKGI